MNTTEAIIHLNNHKKKLTRQQYKTLKGQIQSGNIEGAMKGLKRIMRRKETA